jgi:small subunit ribosomal protein S1
MNEKVHNNNEVTMDQLMNQMEKPAIGRGRVKAEVHSILPDGVFLILDGKLDGFLPESELVRNINEYKKGDELEVLILKNDEEQGQSVVSEKKIYHKIAQKKVEDAFKKKENIEGIIDEEIKGGYQVTLLKGIKAFLPGSESMYKRGRAPLNKKLNFRVIKYRKQRGAPNIVVSLKEIKREYVEKYFEKFELGQVVSGKVESIKNFGAFVKLNDYITALIPASEISWDNTKRISDILKTGENVEGKIINLNLNEEKISLSVKQLTPDPWLDVLEKYPVGGVVNGEVKNITPFGFFVALEPGVEGLVHISEVFWGNVKKDLKSVVETGEMVKVLIKEIDDKKRTISLSYKEVLGNPWDNVPEKYFQDEIYEGKVVKILPMGVIVELEDYVSGFVPVSEISWNFVDSIEDVVKEGDMVKVKILSIDKENEKMRMSIKQGEEDPWRNVIENYSVGDKVTGTVKRFTKNGAIVLIDECNVEAFLPISQVTIRRIEEIEEELNIGDQREFKIIKVIYQPENDLRNMRVSIRQLLKDKEQEEARKMIDKMNEGIDESGETSMEKQLKQIQEKMENSEEEE